MEQVLKNGATPSASLLKRPVIWILSFFLFLLSSIIGFALFIALSLGGDTTVQPELSGPKGTAKVSPEVLRYEPLVLFYAEQFGVKEYSDLILALIMQESGGRHLDVMQSSESIGLPPGTITDPAYSIEIGIQYFAQVLKQAGGDAEVALQAYNMGSGFIPFAIERGGYSKETAREFSLMMAERLGWERYGDVNYVDHVMHYYSESPILAEGSVQRFNVEEVHDVMKSFLGLPYVWGGRNPSAGGFDCSGLLEYAFNQIGINLYGTAASQYEKTVAVPEEEAVPGDLVFFSTYKPGPSHVGMYVGEGEFINANDNGIEYSSVEEWKRLYIQEDSVESRWNCGAKTPFHIFFNSLYNGRTGCFLCLQFKVPAPGSTGQSSEL